MRKEEKFAVWMFIAKKNAFVDQVVSSTLGQVH
jgi:hypothetical protein